MIKEMQSSLLLLMVAHKKPKKFKHAILQSLHFDADEAGHLKIRVTLYCAHPVKGAHKILSIIISCHVYVQ
jgi:hypothetical protein